MAKVFFVKDGTGDEHTSSGFDIPIGEINKALRSFEKKYFASGPTINSGVAGAFSPYRHVVGQSQLHGNCWATDERMLF